MDFTRRKLRLGDVLVENKYITSEQLDEALKKQKGSGKKLGEVLVDEGYLKEVDIARAISKQMSLAYVDLKMITLTSLLPQSQKSTW